MQADLIQNVLADFCAKSSQKVNLHKYKVFFSNVSEQVSPDLSSALGID